MFYLIAGISSIDSMYSIVKMTQEKNVTKTNADTGKHVCDECGKSLSDNCALKLHVNAVHLKLKPFKCEHCDTFFTTISNLNRHVLRKHEEIRYPSYPCHFCDAKYIQRGYLALHIEKNHLEWSNI